MQPKTIHITVKEDGSYTTDFSNFSGADCLAAGKQMHTLLAQFGVQPEQTAMTPKPELLGAEGLLQELNAAFETDQEAHVEG
ncbi:hypothetical protein [Dictyobacter formicarum]|uniref:DUF2997 domain-containing protein n=1 Tax=Dictyobacter formicarum TaxID=2778368 RepID=A0ABQ3V8Y0_9CHLR|nr:hypothetical protein [Dictyobacter formicarum]GHO82294.1 hypothetical protein KSZ_03000 [Dictyobacter formicarum]